MRRLIVPLLLALVGCAQPALNRDTRVSLARFISCAQANVPRLATDMPEASSEAVAIEVIEACDSSYLLVAAATAQDAPEDEKEAIIEEAKQSKRGIAVEVVVPMVDAFRKQGQSGLNVRCKVMLSNLKL